MLHSKCLIEMDNQAVPWSVVCKIWTKYNFISIIKKKLYYYLLLLRLNCFLKYKHYLFIINKLGPPVPCTCLTLSFSLSLSLPLVVIVSSVLSFCRSPPPLTAYMPNIYLSLFLQLTIFALKFWTFI